MSPQEKIANILELFEEVKREIQKVNASFYERWKAGGFLIDSSICSMYPSIADAVPYFDDLECLDE